MGMFESMIFELNVDYIYKFVWYSIKSMILIQFKLQAKTTKCCIRSLHEFPSTWFFWILLSVVCVAAAVAWSS